MCQNSAESIRWHTGGLDSGIISWEENYAIFSNQATLTYNGSSTNSNIAYGEILDVLPPMCRIR